MTTSVVDLAKDRSDAAVDDSDPAENPASVVDPGQDATESADDLPGPAENPCLMTQLRQRWLLAFVRGERGGAFNALVHQASEQFCLEHIELLVKKGLWHDAVEYLNSFLPACPRSFGAQVFHNFLLMHHYIAYAKRTADQPVARVMAPYVVFMDIVRKRMNWVAVRGYAALFLDRLAWQTPELNGRLALPGCPKMQHDVLPAVLGLSPRRHMKKQGPRLNPAAVARVIQGSRRYIRRLKQSTLGTFDKAKEWLSTIIDDSLQYGIPTGGYLLQPNGKEGTVKIRQGCHTKAVNALLVMNLGKNPRAEQPVIEDCFGRMKKQRTTGEFGEASMGPLNEVGVEGHSLAGSHSTAS